MISRNSRRNSRLRDADDDQYSLPLEVPPAPPVTLPQLWTPDDLFNRIVKEGPPAFANFPDEDNRIEWKSARYEPRALADYFSMWANTQPSGGVIVVGMEKDGTLSGCLSQGTDKVSRLEATAPDYCSDAQFDVRKVQVQRDDGSSDFILVFRVFYRDDRLVETVKNEAFVRVGNKIRQLTEDEKREVRISRGQIAHEKEASPLKYPDEFDELLIEEFCSKYISIRRLRESKTREQILRMNHLGEFKDGRFVPNLACTILFANDPRAVVPGAKIRFLRYGERSRKQAKTTT